MASLLDSPRFVRKPEPATARESRGNRLRLGLVLVILAATAAAFAIAEHLKLERSPLRRVRVTTLFSPLCRCASDHARIAFSLRTEDRVRVEIVDASGGVVRHLATAARVGRRPAVFTWDGRNERGSVVRDGSYYASVYLQGDDRTFELTTPIAVDGTPPRLVVTSVRPRTIHARRGGAATVRYHVNEPAVTMLYADGVRVGRIRGTRLSGKIRWRGRIHGEIRRGVPSVELVARDLAGNESQALRLAVRVR